MAVNRQITRAGVVMRRLDARDVIGLANAGHVLRYVGPGGATIATDLDISVVGSHPQDAWDNWRLSDGYDVAIAGVAVVLRSHRIFSRHAHDRQRIAIDVLREINCRGPRIASVQ